MFGSVLRLLGDGHAAHRILQRSGPARYGGFRSVGVRGIVVVML